MSPIRLWHGIHKMKGCPEPTRNTLGNTDIFEIILIFSENAGVRTRQSKSKKEDFLHSITKSEQQKTVILIRMTAFLFLFQQRINSCADYFTVGFAIQLAHYGFHNHAFVFHNWFQTGSFD